MPNTDGNSLSAGGGIRFATGKYPITAYSEFMPPPRLGFKAYGGIDSLLVRRGRSWGWHVTEYEQAFELQPGLNCLARELLARAAAPGPPRAGARHPAGQAEGQSLLARRIARRRRPRARAVRAALAAGSIAHARRQGPRALDAVRRQRARPRPRFLAQLLSSPEATNCPTIRTGLHPPPAGRRLSTSRPRNLADLRRGRLSRSCRPNGAATRFRYWRDEPLPSWTKPYLWAKGDSLRGVKYLLTFTPFAELPPPVRKAYLAGDLHLLPFPGSLVFWGAPPYIKLATRIAAGDADSAAALDRAARGAARHSRAAVGLAARAAARRARNSSRSPRPGAQHVPSHAPLGARASRRRRAGRRPRGRQRTVAHVLFSTAADESACTASRWPATPKFGRPTSNLLLDGPRRRPPRTVAAAEEVAAAGMFGYRFLYPAMRVGRTKSIGSGRWSLGSRR